MRILQCPVPAARLDEGVGATVADTLSYFVMMALVMPPLIDDGAGDGLFRGPATVTPPRVTRITSEAGLLLCAKDVSTLRRGLDSYPATATLTSDEGGLGMIATSYDRTSRSKVGKFVSWGINNARQHFLHDTFKIAAWLTKQGLSYVDNKAANKKLNALFLKMGGDQLYTFADFRKAIDNDSMMQQRGAMILICRTGDIAPGLDVPNGRVMRYINNSVKVKDLAALSTRAFKTNERAQVSGGIFN